MVLYREAKEELEAYRAAPAQRSRKMPTKASERKTLPTKEKTLRKNFIIFDLL